jgi:hypothetical protein
VIVIAGVDVAVATEPPNPFALTTDTEVTVPDPPDIVAHVLSPLKYVLLLGVPVAEKSAISTIPSSSAAAESVTLQLVSPGAHAGSSVAPGTYGLPGGVASTNVAE